MDPPAVAAALSQLRDSAGAEVSGVTRRERITRNNRITAAVLWGIVALFFFAIMAKYVFLAR
jgi:type VI protein secretion system component VasF